MWGTGDQAIQLKVALARAGYYNLAGVDRPDLGSALITQADVEAMKLAMGDSNVNGWGNNSNALGGTSEFDNIMAWLQAAEGLKLGKGEDALERMSKADAQQSLRKWLWDNGLALPEENVKDLSKKIRNGGEQAFEKITDRLTKQYLIPTYPAYAEALKRGETMADLSAPYKNLFAQTLEVDPQTVDLMDPVMQKAMQGIGEVFKLEGDLFFHKSAITQARSLLRENFKGNDEISVSAFRELLGTTRRYALALLLHFDETGHTERVG